MIAASGLEMEREGVEENARPPKKETGNSSSDNNGDEIKTHCKFSLCQTCQTCLSVDVDDFLDASV